MRAMLGIRARYLHKFLSTKVLLWLGQTLEDLSNSKWSKLTIPFVNDLECVKKGKIA